ISRVCYDKVFRLQSGDYRNAVSRRKVRSHLSPNSYAVLDHEHDRVIAYAKERGLRQKKAVHILSSDDIHIYSLSGTEPLRWRIEGYFYCDRSPGLVHGSP